MNKKSKPLPGDTDYKGGTFNATIYVDGKVKDVKTKKDENGNVVYMSITNKFLGLF